MIDDLGSRPKPAQLRRILALIRDHRVTVLSPQGLGVLPYAWLLGRLSGLRMVANYHPSVHAAEASAIASRRSFKARLGYRAICAAFRATRFIAASKEIAAFYRDDCGIPARSIHHQVFGVGSAVYRAPSPEERAQARRALGLAPDMLVCVLSGRLNLVKGHDVAVQAIRMLRVQRPDLVVRCLFAGAGSQRAEIEADAHRDDADRETFRFLGFVNEAERLRDIYWAADTLLLPSRFEGFALVVPEAMCCGAVPIRTPSGGCADQIVDGENGFVVPFNDAAALADRIARLADPARREAMRERAIAFASVKFATSVMVDGTSELYRGVASGAIT